MILLLLSLAVCLLCQAHDSLNYRPVPPSPPHRAKPPPVVAPPAHEPMTYAMKHGVSLETDEEGAYRVGGVAQEGYESLYFDPAATSTEAAATLPKKRMSHPHRSTHPRNFHDSTKITLTFEPEGSGEEEKGEEVIMDTVLEIGGSNRLEPVDGTTIVGNFDPLAAKRMPQLSREARSKRLLTVSGEAKGKYRNPAVPQETLLDGEVVKPRRHRTSQFDNTVVYHPDLLTLMSAPESRRGRSMRGLRRGRGNWHSRRATVISQRRPIILRKVLNPLRRLHTAQ